MGREVSLHVRRNLANEFLNDTISFKDCFSIEQFYSVFGIQ